MSEPIDDKAAQKIRDSIEVVRMGLRVTAENFRAMTERMPQATGQEIMAAACIIDAQTPSTLVEIDAAIEEFKIVTAAQQEFSAAMRKRADELQHPERFN